MDLFNRKKVKKLKAEVLELEYENTCLKDKIAELEAIIENKGWKVPDKKKLIFQDTSNWIVVTHFSEIMNIMNAKNFEIVSFEAPHKLEMCNYGFEIEYRLPPNMASADFKFLTKVNKNNQISYEAKFKFETIK